MSSAVNQRTLIQAQLDAAAFRNLFIGCYERWEIAGSVRRLKAFVGDIEHVVIPKFMEIASGDLFGTTTLVNMVLRRSDELVNAGTLSKHVYPSENGATHRWGDLYRGMDFRGFNNEIFMATNDNWGSVLAIRTGPADFSKRLVCGLLDHGYQNYGGYVRIKNSWNCVGACGWHGETPEWVLASGRYQRQSANGTQSLRCPKCHTDKYLEQVIVKCPSEEQFFRFAGMNFVTPDLRR